MRATGWTRSGRPITPAGCPETASKHRRFQDCPRPAPRLMTPVPSRLPQARTTPHDRFDEFDGGLTTTGRPDQHGQAALDAQRQHRLGLDRTARHEFEPEPARDHGRDERRLHHPEMAADADPWSGAEGNVGVAMRSRGAGRVEPLRVEALRIGPVARMPVQRVRADHDVGPGRDAVSADLVRLDGPAGERPYRWV